LQVKSDLIITDRFGFLMATFAFLMHKQYKSPE